MTRPVIDLSAEQWGREEPFEAFDWLREHDPVHRYDGPSNSDVPYWVLSRWDDTIAISRDHESYSTERGSVFLATQTPEAMEQMRLTLLNMDPPKHNRYRMLVNRGFTPRMIRMIEETIVERATLIVDNVCEKGSAEFVEDVAAELPLQVICEMIGVPESDRHQIFEWSNTLVGLDDPDYRATPEDAELASAQIFAYCSEIAADRRANPRDDIMSALVHAEVDGHMLDDMELNLFFVLLAVAGNETTRNLIAHAVKGLIEHPEAAARLRANPDDDELWNRAVEEFLRWGTSIQNFRRTATKDTEIRGVPIAEGDKVVTYYLAANRDPEVFADPYTFDIDRHPNEHVAFGGGGIHFCLGANLARAEIKAIVRETVTRLPDLAFDGEVRRMQSDFINGLKAMPVAFTPAARVG